MGQVTLWDWLMGIKNHPDNEISSDIYNVMDEDGKVIKQLRYPKQSQMAQEAKAARDAGEIWEVYKTNGLSDEIYEPVSDAKVGISVDPIGGVVKVTGPKWLTAEVINSDSFKQNVSENQELKSMISAYRMSPDTPLTMNDGTTMTAAQMLGNTQKSLQSMFEGYAGAVLARDQNKALYGVNFNDKQLGIAYSGQKRDSDTYNPSAVVYLPKKAEGMFDWSSLESFDAENFSISAKDLFENVYTSKLFDDPERAREFQDAVKEWMKDAAAYNGYDRSDEEIKNARERTLTSEEYKNEVARTRAFYTWIMGNEPERDAAMTAVYWGAGFVTGLTKGFSEAGLNIATGGIELFESLNKGLTGGDEQSARALLLANPVYWGLAALGDVSLALRSGDPIGAINDLGEAISVFAEDSDTEVSSIYKNLKKEYDEGVRGYGLVPTMQTLEALGGGATACGEFFGHMAYKVVENMLVLNKAGKFAETIVDGTKFAKILSESAPSLAKGIALYSSSSAAKAIGFAANVGVQSVFETFIDDKDLVDAAIATGELTPELMDKIKENFIWNAIGEFTPVVGRNIKSAIVSTTPGRALDMALTKGNAWVALKDDKVKRKFFNWLNGFKKNSDIGPEVKTEKQVEGYDLSFLDAKIRAREAILSIPIFRAMNDEEKAVLKDGASYILTGKSAEEVAKLNLEQKQELLKKMAKDADKLMKASSDEELGKAAVDSEAKSVKGSNNLDEIIENAEKRVEGNKQGLIEKAESSKAGINQNYQYMKVALLNRFNIENNFDAILRGEKAKMNEMNAYAGKKADDYNESLNKVAQMERRAIKNGTKLDVPKTGSILSKQSSEYLSLKSQLGRYEWKIENGKFKGDELEKAKEFVNAIKGKMEELSSTLGAELTGQLDKHLVASGRYYASILDYMAKKGYMPKEAYDEILKLRKEGWGENGELYIPTARSFANQDFTLDIRALEAELSVDKIVRGETIPNEIKPYQMGDLENTFMDPTMVMYAHTHQMAKAAQGQDMWRALKANNILSRSISGFGKDGFSEYDLDLIKKGVNGMKNSFREVFYGKSDALRKAVKESFKTTRAVEMGARSIYAAKNVEKMGRTYRNTLVNTASVSDIETILGFAPEGLEIPDFSPEGVTETTFRTWFGKLPRASQAEIVSRLGGQELNIANVKTLFENSPEVSVAMQKNWLSSEAAEKIWKTDGAKEYLAGRAKIDAEAAGNILLKEDAENYLKAMNLAHASRLKKANGKYRAEFAAQTKETTEAIINELIPSVEKASGEDFAKMVDQIVEATGGRIDAETAKRYIILLQLKNIKTSNIAAILAGKGELNKLAKELGLGELKGKELGQANALISNSVSKAIKNQLESELNTLQKLLADNGAGEAMDLDNYWKTVEKYHKEVMRTGGKYVDSEYMDRRIVKAVNGYGEVKLYETDPSTAFLVNTRPTYTRGGKLSSLNQNLNQIFRMGTTGIDRISYINQWFRDPLNAMTVGGALPFTNLRVGGKLRAMLGDYSPLGKRLFGLEATESFSKELVDMSYDAAREGIIAEYGEDYVKELEDGATKGLTGKAADEARKRAVVEFELQKAGYESMPSSGIREAEAYRVSSGQGITGSRKKTLQQARQEEFDEVVGAGRLSKAQRRFDNLMSDYLSRGEWRETFLRKSVWTSQYKTALDSGMTSQEAKIWANRYAMDATTNFGRPFAWGNNIFRNVPYLGAAINGTKSFYRLLELDPVGVSSRFIFGMAMPYTAMLAESLSDPANLEAYKQVPEYEKQDNFIFFYNGHKISIPVPQELAAFLSPFRHVVEKSAGANDATWWNLIASDALSAFPLDMSGFLELDSKTYTEDPTFGDRVSRGFEKAASSLMPPLVKAAYMWRTKRDPYTGREITNQYPTFDDEGNLVMMDSNQSEIAQFLAQTEFFKDIPASGVQKILNTLMGRSTISVLDSAVELMSQQAVSDGEFKKQTIEEWAKGRINEAADQLMKPTSANDMPYNRASIKWNSTIDELYKERDALITNELFTKAYRTLQSSTASEAQKESSLRTYRELLDEYDKKVLTMANKLVEEHPYAYTTTRQAQIISLLTLPTGLTYNETEYAKDMRDNAYYDAKARAIGAYVKMGFPENHNIDTILGRGYYDSSGTYQFKIYTPYEIQYYRGGLYGTGKEVAAQIDHLMEASDIKSGDMWDAYYSANTKAERKQIMSDWNAKTVPLLAPIIQKYGVDYVASNSAMKNALKKYIYVGSTSLEKYLKEIFGED